MSIERIIESSKQDLPKPEKDIATIATVETECIAFPKPLSIRNVNKFICYLCTRLYCDAQISANKKYLVDDPYLSGMRAKLEYAQVNIDFHIPCEEDFTLSFQLYINSICVNNKFCVYAGLRALNLKDNSSSVVAKIKQNRFIELKGLVDDYFAKNEKPNRSRGAG